ncbi:MAG: hypothetical protein QOE75_115 [Solirubrobacterales bacterium]|jgi:hypothetical protein|nr:hypothetical protein [Solirubrobacterales bacterium]
MTRKLQVCALGMIAALSMSTMAASAAQAANDVTAAEYPASVVGTQTNENVISNGIRSFTCSSASLTAELAAPSSTIPIQASYSGCTGNGNMTVTINMNGCSYLLHITSETTATTGLGATTIVCSAGKNIQMDMWATGKSHSEGKLCRLELPAQNAIPNVEYHVVSVGGGRTGIELTLISSSVKLLRTEGTAVNCGAAEKTNGTYTGNVLATGLNGVGEGISLVVD